jgi:ElaB/YqjD/DUF883 family membrane-anchored ribosome-binding protein
MAETQRMTEQAESIINNAADKARDAAEMGGDSIRRAADKVSQSAKEGLKTAQHLADAAQDYIQDSGLADLNLREFVKREPWIALGAAFAIGYAAARLMRRLS